MGDIGHVYLLQLREFHRAGEEIYKFGSSIHIVERVKQYPKNSIIIFIRAVNNCRTTEQNILLKLRENFISRTDIGKEYFEGRLESILDLITKSIPALNLFSSDVNQDDDAPVINSSEESSSVETESKKINDTELIVQTFMDAHKLEFNKSVFKSSDVYKKFCEWIDADPENTFKKLSWTRLTSILKKNYGLITKPYRFDDGVSQGIIFGDLVSADDDKEDLVKQWFDEYMYKTDPTATMISFTNMHTMFETDMRQKITKEDFKNRLDEMQITGDGSYYTGIKPKNTYKSIDSGIVDEFFEKNLIITKNHDDKIQATILLERFKKFTPFARDKIWVNHMMVFKGFPSKKNYYRNPPIEYNKYFYHGLKFKNSVDINNDK